jgi:hypothetical protein
MLARQLFLVEKLAEKENVIIQDSRVAEELRGVEKCPYSLPAPFPEMRSFNLCMLLLQWLIFVRLLIRVRDQVIFGE